MSSTRRMVGGQGGGQIHGGGGLSNSALLICNCDDPLHFELDLGGAARGRTGESSTRCRSSSSPGTLSLCTASTRKLLGQGRNLLVGRLPFMASKRPPGAHKCPGVGREIRQRRQRARHHGIEQLEGPVGLRAHIGHLNVGIAPAVSTVCSTNPEPSCRWPRQSEAAAADRPWPGGSPGKPAPVPISAMRSRAGRAARSGCRECVCAAFPDGRGWR